MAKHKRILVKLSGEQVGYPITDPRTGKEVQIGFDPEQAKWLASEVKKLLDHSIEVVITIGGGNFLRGAEVKCDYITDTEADEAGILATIMNAMLLRNVFIGCGLPVHAMSKVDVPTFIDGYSYRSAIHDLSKGKVVIIGGGSGQTGFTSDVGALNAATSLDCGLVIKATKVDGVYDSDPTKNPSAKKFDQLGYDKAIVDPAISVMDKAALGMAAGSSIPIIVCALKEDNILNSALGKSVGTIICDLTHSHFLHSNKK